MLRALRLALRLQACLLLVFLCSVGAAVAQPWLSGSHGLMVVCSDGAGLRLVDGNTGDPAQPGTHTLECPLCLPLTGTVSCFHAAAVPMPTGDATRIARHGALRQSSNALRPPARAPPCHTDSSTR